MTLLGMFTLRSVRGLSGKSSEKTEKPAKSKKDKSSSKSLVRKDKKEKKKRPPSFTVPRNPYKYKYFERSKVLPGNQWTPFHTSSKHHCGLSADNLLNLNRKISSQVSGDVGEIASWVKEQKVDLSQSMENIYSSVTDKVDDIITTESKIKAYKSMEDLYSTDL